MVLFVIVLEISPISAFPPFVALLLISAPYITEFVTRLLFSILPEISPIFKLPPSDSLRIRPPYKPVLAVTELPVISADILPISEVPFEIFIIVPPYTLVPFRVLFEIVPEISPIFEILSASEEPLYIKP